MDKKKLLTIKNLVKHYPVQAGGLTFSTEKVHALNGISLDVDYQQTLGLVGESGCGKTTTGRVILKVIEATSGRLFFEQTPEAISLLTETENAYHAEQDEKKKKQLHRSLIEIEKEVDFLSYPDRKMVHERLKMQYIFQDPYMSLNPKMHIRDIITENLVENKLIKKNERDTAAKKYLDIVGIPQTALYKYPHEFSGGQRQRINIARAIAVNPKFIVCDEPVSSLDVSIQSQILNLLIDIQKELGISYLFIAHNLSVVFYMSDNVAVMYAGKIVEYASSRILYKKACHPYTKLLMAASPRLGETKDYTKLPPMGQVPSLINFPKGCTFYDRCPIRQDMCMDSFPPLTDKGDGHLCACFVENGKKNLFKESL